MNVENFKLALTQKYIQKERTFKYNPLLNDMILLSKLVLSVQAKLPNFTFNINLLIQNIFNEAAQFLL